MEAQNILCSKGGFEGGAEEYLCSRGFWTIEEGSSISKETLRVLRVKAKNICVRKTFGLRKIEEGSSISKERLRGLRVLRVEAKNICVRKAWGREVL